MYLVIQKVLPFYVARDNTPPRDGINSFLYIFILVAKERKEMYAFFFFFIVVIFQHVKHM